jgi:hypothetical protein
MLSADGPELREGLDFAPGHSGCPDPTLEPLRDTGEQTSVSAMIVSNK